MEASGPSVGTDMRDIAPERKVIVLLAAGVAVFGLFDVLVWRAVLAEDGPRAEAVVPVMVPAPVAVAQVPTAPVAEESVGLPVRIRIPEIELDAAVVEVALAPDGSMDVPESPHDSGWYALGPRPGEKGSATIGGHVDWKHGANAVFAKLHKIRPGDEIEVLADDGSIVSFIVRESRKYDAAADATEVFGSNDGKSHLNIVTCDGIWDKRINGYSERLVVFADKVVEVVDVPSVAR